MLAFAVVLSACCAPTPEPDPVTTCAPVRDEVSVIVRDGAVQLSHLRERTRTRCDASFDAAAAREPDSLESRRACEEAVGALLRDLGAWFGEWRCVVHYSVTGEILLVDL